MRSGSSENTPPDRQRDGRPITTPLTSLDPVGLRADSSSSRVNHSLSDGLSDPTGH